MEKRRHEYNQGKKDAVLLFQHAVPAALTLTNTDYQMKTTRIMNKIIIYLSAVLLLCSCGSARHYAAFQYDNGDDYVSEGLYRIVDRKGRIGYADETGKTVIRPRFAFGYPFEGGKAKVTDSGNGKRWQAPAASTGIGKVMTGTTLTNKGTGVRIKIQTRTKHIHNTAITPEVQMRAFGVSL